MKVLALVAVALATYFLPVGSALHVNSADAAQSAQAASRCQNIQLDIRFQSSQGAAGTIVTIYRIHNLGSRSCTLFGYPGVQLLDRRFLSLPTTVHRGGSVVGTIPQRLVRLRGYGNAYFTLAYSDVPVNNLPCATASYLMIFPPNDFLPVVTYAVPRGGILACAGNIHVSPVTARPRFQ